jgi:hypothetical protein
MIKPPISVPWYRTPVSKTQNKGVLRMGARGVSAVGDWLIVPKSRLGFQPGPQNVRSQNDRYLALVDQR